MGWIMVDLRRSRRGYNYKCFYWKRDISQTMDNEELVHNSRPTGVFYAKIVSSKSNDKQDIAGVFRVGIEGISIETQDIVDIDKDDLVQFDGSIWIVGRVNSDPVQKNAMFGHHSSKITVIELDKGN